MPKTKISSADVARELIHDLTNSSPASQLSQLGDEQLATLDQLANIFGTQRSAQLPRVKVPPAAAAPAPRVATTSLPTDDSASINPNRRRRIERLVQHLAKYSSPYTIPPSKHTDGQSSGATSCNHDFVVKTKLFPANTQSSDCTVRYQVRRPHRRLGLFQHRRLHMRLLLLVTFSSCCCCCKFRSRYNRQRHDGIDGRDKHRHECSGRLDREFVTSQRRNHQPVPPCRKQQQKGTVPNQQGRCWHNRRC